MPADANVSRIAYMAYRKKMISAGDIPDTFSVWKQKQLGK